MVLCSVPLSPLNLLIEHFRHLIKKLYITDNTLFNGSGKESLYFYPCSVDFLDYVCLKSDEIEVYCAQTFFFFLNCRFIRALMEKI